MQHPFFPGKEGEEAPHIDWIHVCRQGVNGLAWAPRMYPPNEIQDLETVYRYFGGGNYVLQARANNKIVAQFRVTLEGPSKPLVDEASAAQASPAPPAHAPMFHAPSQDSSLVVAIMQMSQQNQQMMMQMMMESSKQQSAMLTAMLGRGDNQQASMIAAITETSRQTQQSQADFFKTVMELQGKSASGGGNIDAFKEGMDLGTTITEIVKKNDSDDGLGSTIGALMQGVAQMKAVQNGPGQA